MTNHFSPQKNNDRKCYPLIQEQNNNLYPHQQDYLIEMIQIDF